LLLIDKAGASGSAPTGEPGERVWRFRQVLDDPAGDHDWAIEGVVDLSASEEAGEPVIRVERVGSFAA
jgi:hypothetical protein